MHGIGSRSHSWVALALVTVAALVHGRAQTSSPPPSIPPPSSLPRMTTLPHASYSTGNDFPAFDPNFSHRQMVARREEVKKRMSENAARLLSLTRGLQADLQSRPANEADGKRLDEIAKLARSVRDQMRQ